MALSNATLATWEKMKLANPTMMKAFENTSSSVAASQMRNALNALADTVKDPKQKEVWSTPIIESGYWASLTIPFKLFETEMDNFFALFRRYLVDKSKGNTVYVLNVSFWAQNY